MRYLTIWKIINFTSTPHALLYISQSCPLHLSSCTTKDWLMPTKAGNFMSRNTAFKQLHQSLVLLFLRQRRHTVTNNSTNYTSRTMEPRLHNGQEISRHFQLHNAHRDVDVGRVVANKSEFRNPNHFDISYLRNLKPFSLLCN